MKFDNLKDANNELSDFRNLMGVFYSPAKQKIWGLFVGVSDKTMSENIYQGIRGNLPEHVFTSNDLNSIEFWAGFCDDSIVRIREVIQDEYFVHLCEPGALNKEVNISEEWSEPIPIPKGLGFKMTFWDDKEIWYEIFDSKNPGNAENADRNHIQRYEGFTKLFRYENTRSLVEMEEPSIKFKLPDNYYDTSGISLLFVNE